MLGTFFMIFLDFAMMKWKHANTSTSMASSSTLPSHATTEESIKPDIHTGCCHDEARLTAWQSPHPHHSDSDMTTKKFGFYVLEIGIALHSVIVGFTLGLTPSTSYLSMMIAVIFHQFFEGFALGALAAPLYLSRFALCTLIFFFSMTTTLGASLGTLLQAVSNMDVNHPVNLILQGVMSSLSSGIMIYSALLDVIVPELKHPSFYSLSTQQQTVSLFSMLVGATIMAVLAKWA
ncbi:high-affinity Zn(2+) transporter zrt1 [Coelomomyces lativittatus]|nr:high-affinity Zn(2+) transporter zrt1 [Coelomomyces lativittatus]KAJ1499461.1 high-affinity Zn(2+) transporter zrt1 [Coelomomyces lativittatus]KAJ1500226.1 high-affinity Zn(2+) transporter zrt1 [Coelomomyces lativittatus]